MSKIIVRVCDGLVVGVSTDSKDEFDVEIWDEDVLANSGFLDNEEQRETEENDQRLSKEYFALRPIY